MTDSLRRILALARLVLLDGLRRHALLGLVALAVAAEAGALLFFDFIPRDIGRASSDFVLSVAWLVGFIFIYFHGVQVIALDEERKVVYSILARPISRGEYVTGVFAGLAGLLLLLNLLLCGLGFGALLFIKNQVPGYFSQFDLLWYLLSWFGLAAMELMLLAVILLFSGLVRGGFPVLLISLSFYAICSGLPVVRDSVAQKISRGASELTGLKSLLQWLTAVFPDFDRLDFKNMVVSSASLPELSIVLTNFGLVAAYIVIFMWLACIVYQRRDLQ